MNRKINKMILFNSDYIEGAHPAILDALVRTNFEQTPGYGEDKFCEEARDIIREHCGNNELGVRYVLCGRGSF